MAFAMPMIMPNSESLPPRRARRILIALLLLLLILLPLYLWPARGPGGPAGASALPGSVPDPRSAAAVARIPSAVWDALMGPSGAPAPAAPSPTKAPGNLTMITEIEARVSDSPALLAHGLIVQLVEPSDPSGDKPGDALALSTPVEFLASSAGTGAGSPSGGVPDLSNPSLGPWGGGSDGGPRFSSSGPTFAPGELGVLEPTPEPATLLLVGSNLVLLAGAAYRRRRRRLGSASMG